jgi:hypothetical protein
MHLRFITLSALCLALAGAGDAQARDRTEHKRLRVVTPDDATNKLLVETIDVNLNGTVADALKTISTKTGWSLIASTPKLDQRLSLHTAKRPLGEALDLLLEASELHATLRPGGKLVVKDRHPDDDEDEEEPAEEDDDEIEERTGPTIAIAPPPVVPVAPGQLDRVNKNGRERTSFGQDLVIKKSETVTNAVANGGDLIIEGRVTKDAVAVGGDVIVKNGGVVERDAVAMGGDVHIENGGIVKGNTQMFGEAFGGVIKDLVKKAGRSHESEVDHDRDDDDSGTSGFFIAKVTFALLAFILNIMLIAFVPERVERIIQTLDERPLPSGGAGFALLLGFLPFCLVLVVTIVGIALLPVVFVLYGFAYTIGYTALSVYLGRKLPVLKSRKTTLGAMALGLLALTLVALVPYIGSVIVFLTASFATGAVVISRVGSGPRISDGDIPPPAQTIAMY